MLRLGLLGLVCMSCVACSGNGGSSAAATPAGPVTPGTPTTPAGTLPPTPSRAANNATLAGLDTTGLGLRDDMYRQVFTTYTSPVKRQAGMAVAKIIYSYYSTPPTTQAEALVSAKKLDAVVECLDLKGVSVHDRHSIVRSLEASGADSAARTTAFWNYQSLLSGTTYESHDPSPTACDGIIQ